MKFTHPGQRSKISFLSHYSHLNWVSLLKQLDLDVVFITNARLARRTGVLLKRFIGERKAWMEFEVLWDRKGAFYAKIALSARLFAHHLHSPSKIYRFFLHTSSGYRQDWAFLPPFNCSYWKKEKKNRIYSINRPGRLLNFWSLRVGAYKIFTLFNKCSMYILQQNSKWQ